MYILYVIFIGEEKAGRMKTMNMKGSTIWITWMTFFKLHDGYLWVCMIRRFVYLLCKFMTDSLQIIINYFRPSMGY